MKTSDRGKAIGKALVAVSSDTVIRRSDEKLFGILFANHFQMNGHKHDINPDLLILSMRDTYHELEYHKEYNPQVTVESVFTQQHIRQLIEKGWYSSPEEKTLNW